MSSAYYFKTLPGFCLNWNLLLWISKDIGNKAVFNDLVLECVIVFEIPKFYSSGYLGNTYVREPDSNNIHPT